MPELAPPVLDGRVISRQGCRTLAAYAHEALRPQDVARCAQPGEGDGRVYRWHNGVDFGAPEGTPILAVAPGIIRRVYQVAGYWQPGDSGSGGYGRSILVEHAPAVYSYSAHCSTTRVDVGAHVEQGEPIAAVGRTAGSEADPAHLIGVPHLHFEIVARWPLRSDQIDDRYDVIATLAELGIVEHGSRMVWSAPQIGPPQIVAAAEPAELVASPGGALVLRSPSGPPPGEPTPPAGRSGGVLLLAGAWWLARRRRRST